MEPSCNEVLAFHEAGHAVVAWKLRIRILAVGISIKEGKGYCHDALRNRTLTGEMIWSDDRVWARKKTLILLAGAAAERVYYELLEQHDLPLCSSDDQMKLDELCCGAFGSLGPEASQWIKQREDETRHIVEDEDTWVRICRLAQRLLDQSVLSGDEAEWAIRGKHGIVWDLPNLL